MPRYIYGVPQPKAAAQPASRVIRQAAPVSYTDSASGALRLSGSAVELFVAPAPRVTRVTAITSTPLGKTRLVTPPAVTVVYTDSAGGTLRLSGTSVESFVAPAPTVLRQPRAQRGVLADPVSRSVSSLPLPTAVSYTDAAGGTLRLSGSALESFTTTIPINVLAGGFWEQQPEVGRSRAIQILGPARFFDTSTGTLVLSGSATEDFHGLQGAPPFDPNFFLLIHS